MRLIFLLCAALLPACTSHRTAPPKPGSDGFSTSHFAKTDLDRVTETHQQELFASLRVLAERLYRRNPRELKKSGQRGVEAAVSRIFDRHHGWQFEDLQLQRGAQAIQLAFRADFAGDRVLAFVVGQVYLVARVAVRLQFAASQIALFQSRLAHAGYVARPVPRWPDSPAAAALGPDASPSA